ncbi:multidrug efflux RND transporter permease subunit [Alteromonas aestuariivivens]|uniref:Efflux pump membrane transporter n=1 Tax=Alteromonas aestuariivivens TaxID=1938339 RepID=A0A3D8MGB0_9ALTE|nr:multidrug efflux RND transporter permease subunit [Alteromonas aestuariivivens]RDV29258.1 multidrug efflux RND transporter permease subunit [Alteromonas aestuariivivens]
MISQTFIERPKFALVISIVITLAGLIALIQLPVNKYPEVTPPQVRITTTFPGASAQVVEESVIRPIEEQVNGVEDMMYITSRASFNGVAVINVVFKVGTDSDIAQVNVQNRVALAEPRLPPEVKKQGISVKKRSSNMLLGVNLFSDRENMNSIYLSNYATNFLTEPLGRLPGVAEAKVMSNQQYSMRIWLNPERMQALSLTVADLQAALNEQNVIVAAGKLGSPPTPESQQFQYTIQAQGRLDSVEEFEDIIVRANPDGNFVRLGDIADIEIGAYNYGITSKLNKQDTAFLVIYQLPDANATEVAKLVKARMKELAANFPDGLEYTIPYDSTTFIEVSIEEVVHTLYEAIILVILVVFLFLQNWRATLIPCIAIPVSLIGTFAFMLAMDYSINTITLFGLVLAIGIVVDDAIIVIENVERLVHENPTQPMAQTVSQAMKEVSGPVIATTSVLLAVFVPVSFMPGLTGELYKQFSITISIAVLISAVNALTLSPALCVMILSEKTLKPMAWLRPLEKFIHALTGKYTSVVKVLLRRAAIFTILVVVIFGGTGWLSTQVPTGFIPDEDQGFFFVDVQLPDAASANRTNRVMEKIADIVLEEPSVTDFISVAGVSLLAGDGSNNGLGVVVLKDWEERLDPAESLPQIIGRLQSRTWALSEASIMMFNPPAIAGLGTSSGFDYRLQDTEGRSPSELAQVMNGLIYEANDRPELTRVFSNYRANVPQYMLEVDRNKAKAQGVALTDIYATLQTQLGALYVNDFNLYGRTYRVMLQAAPEFRLQPADLQNYFVRNSNGDMVPITSLAKLEPILGPTAINHFNLYRNAAIKGEPSPGYSSGDAIRVMQELSAQLPAGYTFEWAGQSKQELEAGNLAPILFGLSVIFVYLFLVALYESWLIPFAVILAVPLAVFGAMLALYFTGLPNDIYAQVGLVLLIAMSTKTAILIVEFAMMQRKAGISVFESALTAAKLRFRAVLMTSLAFVFGVLPLVIATGAGAGSRVALGVPVMAGMISVTILSTLLVPLYYLLFQSLREWLKKDKAAATE